VGLQIDVDKTKKDIRFSVVNGMAIKKVEGTKRQRGPAICPYCDQPTSEKDLRFAGQSGEMGERLVGVVAEGHNGKEYRSVEDADLVAFRQAQALEVEAPGEYIVPEINSPSASSSAGSHRIPSSSRCRVSQQPCISPITHVAMNRHPLPDTTAFTSIGYPASGSWQLRVDSSESTVESRQSTVDS